MGTLPPMGGCMGGVDVWMGECVWFCGHACIYTCQFKLQMAVPPIRPPIGGGVSTDNKSSNRIELS